jgi:hypothetical protein
MQVAGILRMTGRLELRRCKWHAQLLLFGLPWQNMSF